YSPPCITARRGGRAIKKISRSIRRAPRSASAPARSLKRGRGGFPMRTKGKPPRLRQLRWLREIFLMTQTPLLAVMQGGESRSIPIFSQLHRPRLQPEPEIWLQIRREALIEIR